MRWTNVHDLPQPIFEAVTNDRYKLVGDISVTQLIGAPRRRILIKRHWGEMTDDASNHIYRLLGQAVHRVLEWEADEKHLAEEILVHEVLGWRLKGGTDLLRLKDGKLSDYKVTSVFSSRMEKPDWEAQLNTYAYLFKEVKGIEIKELEICAILRDWVSSKADESDYPPAAFQRIPVPLWTHQVRRDYVAQRIKLHQRAENFIDDKLPDCTDEERWQRPPTYAVMKGANKRATRVFERQDEATAFVLKSGKEDLAVIQRAGQAVRCERFCQAAPWCNQYRKTIPAGTENMAFEPGR